ncbi:unnamed protein product [Darwinula stevensoni]|uniref:ABC transporter domain-containing protein n=1 Tax=Darwinula stevensoni TaxID=69355 RepID=A0A7R8WZ18_9CRUS|nr:unnamed protein product [Darwinula stevensoni]CAG0880063.1 unnamed protein product [Darwinula stevensoni]
MHAPAGSITDSERKSTSLSLGKHLGGTGEVEGQGKGQEYTLVRAKPNRMLSHLPRRPPVEIEYLDINYKVSKGRKGVKHILKELDGHMRSGQLTAIMGPSGAGKSCLMNVLAGYTTKGVTGTVTVNGRARNLGKFRKLSAYITQEDHLMECLSVGESMAMAANLKLPTTLSQQEKATVVTEILENLGLCECVKTRARSLSGGQRKRLCIALELVNNPPIMFFDEPTSGLDSSSCVQCISLLETLAREGRTIICTIHQPSARVLEMFSQLILLADGKCFYSGSVKSLIPYLGETHGLQCPSYHNPADYVMELAVGEHGEEPLERLVQATRDGKCREYDLEYNKDFFRTSSRLNQQNNGGISRDNSSLPVSNDVVPGPGGEGEKKQNGETKVCVEESLLGEKPGVEEEGNEHVPSFAVSFWTQVRILFYRSLLSTVRDTVLMNVRIACHIGVGLLIGMMYFDLGDDATKVYNNAGALFFNIIFLMFTAMMPTILTCRPAFSCLEKTKSPNNTVFPKDRYERLVAEVKATKINEKKARLEHGKTILKH